MNDNTHISREIITSLYFISLHFTTLLSPFFISLYFWTFRHHTSKTLHFSTLNITFLNLFLRICDLQWKVASASADNFFHNLIFPYTQRYLPISVLCFLALILRW